MVQLSQLYVTTEKTIALTIRTFFGRVMSLLFNALFVSVWFHSCSHCLQWFWSPWGGNLSLLPHCLFYLLCSNGAGCHGPFFFLFFFYYLVLSWLFHSPPSPSPRGSLVPLCFLLLVWYNLHIWGCWYFFQQSYSTFSFNDWNVNRTRNTYLG